MKFKSLWDSFHKGFQSLDKEEILNLKSKKKKLFCLGGGGGGGGETVSSNLHLYFTKNSSFTSLFMCKVPQKN